MAKRTHVLLIDDDRELRRTMARALERAGYRVTEAADGDTGIGVVAFDGADVVICDIFMPKREGLGTITELRERDPRLKILAISGGGSVGRKTFFDLATEAGADATLQKPFRPAELVEAVERLAGTYERDPATGSQAP